MLSFITYLTEARAAPLYHSTNPQSMLYILDDGFNPATEQRASKLLMKNSKHSSGKDAGGRNFSGVSFTRNPRFAKKWEIGHGWYFEVDQSKIIQNYKIVPLQYWQVVGFSGKHDKDSKARYQSEKHMDNEFEEFVLTKKKIPATVITKIHYLSTSLFIPEYLPKLQAKVLEKNLNIEFVPY